MRLSYFIVSVLLLFVHASNVIAQNKQAILLGSITSRSGDAVIGAQVFLASRNDSIPEYGSASDEQGEFRLSQVPFGLYKLEIKSFGYLTYQREINVDTVTVHLGIIKLDDDIVVLKTVDVEANAARAVMDGDTIKFNASAFKVNENASAEDLIGKMPGMSVENGVVKAQGEQVKKVLVDGKPFFGDDPTIPLKNFPADMIDKIQVYDKSSDQTEFTGFKDGETEKTINIQTKKEAKGVPFGKIYAGYGTGNHYNGGGAINYFKGTRRISLLGTINDINNQNFSSEDILGISSGGSNSNQGSIGNAGGFPDPQRSSSFLVGTNNGINSTRSLGLNFSNQIGPKLEMDGSYFYNEAFNTTRSDIWRKYFLVDSLERNYSEISTTHSHNVNNRLNARIQYKINAANTLIFTPSVAVQGNSSTRNVDASFFDASHQISDSGNQTSSKNNGYTISNSILFKHQFLTKGRTFSMNLKSTASSTKESKFLDAFTTFNSVSDSTAQTRQNNVLLSKGTSLNATIVFTEPLGDRSQLLIQYIPGYSLDKMSKEVTALDQDGEGYALMNSSLSGKYSIPTISNSGGMSYRYSSAANKLTIGIDAQHIYRSGSTTSDVIDTVTNAYRYLLPRLDFMHNFNKRSFYHFGYFTSTQMPTTTQLFPVADNSNPLNVSIGSATLAPKYTHSVMTAFRHIDATMTKTLFLAIHGSVINNVTATSTMIAMTDTTISEGVTLSRESQLTRQINLNGYKSVSVIGSYGFPIPIRCNLNLNGGYNYTEQPSLVNNKVNHSKATTWNGGLTMSSNISERIDFSIGYNAAYNKISNSMQGGASQNYYSGNVKLKTTIRFLDSWKITNDLTNSNYIGLSAGNNRNVLLYNASLGYLFLKNKTSEISVSAFDLFNQNRSISRNITSSYLEDVNTLVLRRYFMLNVTWKL